MPQLALPRSLCIRWAVRLRVGRVGVLILWVAWERRSVRGGTRRPIERCGLGVLIEVGVLWGVLWL